MEPFRVCFAILLIKSAARLLAANTDDNQGINSRLLYTPKKGWVNDPNGLVYANGTYHLFYQHNPYSNADTNISWGHATSPDLVNWTDMGVAIPFDETAQIQRFSGNAVVNSTNASSPATDHRIVAIYTDAYNKTGTQSQSIARSDDGGKTFQSYAENPVIPSPPPQYASEYQNFRDPKVFWYPPQKTWLMVVSLSDLFTVLFYWSPDLVRWTYKGNFSSEYTPREQWECPDLFPLPAGNGTTKWVLLISTNPGGVAGGSGMHYHIGDFNGTHFVEYNPKGRIRWLNWGTDCYAGTTFNDVPGRRIMFYWVNNWNYAQNRSHVYKGGESFGHELSLGSRDGDYRVLQKPVSELDKYATNATTYSKAQAEAGIPVPISGRQAYKMDICIGGPGNFQIKLVHSNGSRVQYCMYNNFTEKTISVKKTNVDPAANGTKVMYSAPYDAANKTCMSMLFDLHCVVTIVKPGFPVSTHLVPAEPIRDFFVLGPDQADVNVTRFIFNY